MKYIKNCFTPNATAKSSRSCKDDPNKPCNKHAPEKVFTPREKLSEWWTGNCQEAKTMRRKMERIFLQNMSCPAAKKIYRKASQKAASIIDITRNTFYKDKLIECTGDAKKTYSVVNKLLNKEKICTNLPTAKNDHESASKFADFFKEKVDRL